MGGKSSRMGKDKALLEIGGKMFLENAIDALRPACASIKVVLNKSQTHFIEKIPDDVPHIFDHFEDRGAPGGIHAALMDSETEYAIVLAVDLQSVSGEAFRKLCEIAVESKDFAAIVPRQNDERLQPLCAIYRVKDCYLKLEEILTKNESASVKNFLEKINTKIVEAEILDENQNLFLNVNNRNEYKYLINTQR